MGGAYQVPNYPIHIPNSFLHKNNASPTLKRFVLAASAGPLRAENMAAHVKANITS